MGRVVFLEDSHIKQGADFGSWFMSSLWLFVGQLSLFMCTTPQAGACTSTETENSEHVIGSLSVLMYFFPTNCEIASWANSHSC
jgi:hypothetical protein